MAFQHPAPTPPGASIVLFAGLPGAADLVDALTQALDDVEVVAADGVGESPVIRGRHGTVTVLVAPVAGPLARAEIEAACHPVWWEDPSPTATHTDHVVVVAQADAESPEDARTHALHQALSTSTAAAALTALEGASAVYAAAAGGTFPADAYRDYLALAREAQRLPVGVWVTTWLDPAEGATVDGYTHGLAAFGHAELEVSGSEHEPSDVYNLLASLADHILMTGDRLHPGHTLGWADGVHEVAEAAESTDAHPVLAIAF